MDKQTGYTLYQFPSLYGSPKWFKRLICLELYVWWKGLHLGLEVLNHKTGRYTSYRNRRSKETQEEIETKNLRVKLWKDLHQKVDWPGEEW